MFVFSWVKIIMWWRASQRHFLKEVHQLRGMMCTAAVITRNTEIPRNRLYLYGYSQWAKITIKYFCKTILSKIFQQYPIWFYISAFKEYFPLIFNWNFLFEGRLLWAQYQGAISSANGSHHVEKKSLSFFMDLSAISTLVKIAARQQPCGRFINDYHSWQALSKARFVALGLLWWIIYFSYHHNT